MARERGTVKWFEGGYGFIKRDSGGEIFVHWSEIKAEGYKKLTCGDVVEFEAGLDNRVRSHAADVVVVKPVVFTPVN